MKREEVISRLREADAAITGTVLARMGDPAIAKLVVSLKSAAQLIVALAPEALSPSSALLASLRAIKGDGPHKEAADYIEHLEGEVEHYIRECDRLTRDRDRWEAKAREQCPTTP